MKRKLIFMLALVAMACLFTLSVSAAPEKPTLAVDFGEVQEISGFTPPSQKFVNTDERVVLFDGENYITYPTYYIMADVANFNDNNSFSFGALSDATGKDFGFESIFLLELPEGITSLAGWAVYECKNCVYVKVPSTVVTCSDSTFAETPWLQAVEFEDGTASITMGEKMFYKCDALKYVKLPNNLKTMGKIAFSWCNNLETLILGTSFEKFASSNNNFNGTANGKDQTIHIYISTAFGSTGLNDTMFTYNSTATKDENAKMVFHYAGTQAQAQSLQNLALGTSNNGKISYATILSKEELATTTLDPKKNYIVYGYETCEVFYEGEHDYQGTGFCVDGFTCKNCNKVIAGTDSHKEVRSTAYVNGYTQGGVYSVKCINEGCTLFSETPLAPIFSALAENGYSTNGTGISFGGYVVDTDALKDFNNVNKDAKLTFGVVILNPKYLGETFFDENGNVNATKGYIKVDFSDTEYRNIKVMIDGFNTLSAKETELVIALYAYTDEAKVEFIQSEDTASASTSVTKGETSLYTVSVNSVMNKPNASVDALPPYENKENA